jgi:hypothetical protein
VRGVALTQRMRRGDGSQILADTAARAAGCIGGVSAGPVPYIE